MSDTARAAVFVGKRKLFEIREYPIPKPRDMRAGTVWVNAYGKLPVTASFGGYKRSGWGREGGRDSILEYTHIKNILVDLQ